MTDERRGGPRRRTLKGGEIVFHDGSSSIDCQIRNDSPDGAQLTLESIIGVPDRFILLGDGEPKHCVVIWKRANRLGVRFEGDA